MKKIVVFPLFILFFLLFISCGGTEKIAYFQNYDQANIALSAHLYDARIMPKDVLQIRVFTMNPEASEPFNLMKANMLTSANMGQNQNTVFNYLVDNDGNIVFPVLGTLHLGGMSKNEAEAYIKSKIAPYLSAEENAVVHVRMINYKYSVLGEVNHPGMFTTQNEKISILEAIAQAGDLTIYGVRDRVKLIRENAKGHKEIIMLNLNDAEIINSPYYYLQQNDVLYVEPNSVKAKNSAIGTSTTIWISVTGALVSLASLIVNILR